MTRSSRRRTLVAFLALFALLVAACGGDDDDSDADSDSDAAEDFDPNAVIKVAAPLSNDAGVRFEPIAMLAGQSVYSYSVLGGWVARDSKGEYSPDLAKEVTVVDPSTIRVEMKPNLAFSNSEKLDATAAKATIDRNIAANNSAGLRVAELGLIASVEVSGPTTFTIKLKTPSIAQFYPLLADAETAPVAPASIAANNKTSKTVIGAGPFKIDSYNVGVDAVLSKNPTYYAAKDVTLGGIRYIHADNPTAIDTALRSKTVDFGVLPITQAGQLESLLEVVYDQQPAPLWLNQCVRTGTPLDNLDVRKALNHAIDRDAIAQVIYNGKTDAAWALAPSDTNLGNKATDNAYPHDVKKAKDLLTKASYTADKPLKLTLVYSADQERLGVLLQSQLKEAGVTLDLRVTQNVSTDWYQNPQGDLNVVPMIREGVGRLTRLVTSDAFANVCKQPRPGIDDITKKLIPLDPTDSEADKLWDDANKVFVDNAYGVPLVWSVVSYIYNADTVSDLPTITNSILVQQPDYAHVKMTG